MHRTLCDEKSTRKDKEMTMELDHAGVRAQLSSDASALNLVEFWKQRMEIEIQEPRLTAVPHHWKWSDISPRLAVAASTVPIEECERRALVFSNPGLSGKPYITQTLFAAYSLYNPGERAPVHRHTPNASRFVLEGNGGFTVVNGEKIQMSRGDLVLTPNGCWHDHGNEGTEPVIWVDVLDVPLSESLNATIFEFDYVEDKQPKTTQSIAAPSGYSTHLYSRGGLTPTFVDHRRGRVDHSPMFVYRWKDTRAALDAMSGLPGSPYDAITVEYTNPVSGGPVLQTMSYRSTLLRAAERTLPQRRTSSSVFVVLEGTGKTEINGKTFEWKPNDVFCAPAWSWYHHESTSGEAVLYSVTDEPALKKLGFMRKQGRNADGTLCELE
jgi:gentisate 1,2-dioxygenase